MSQTQTRRSSQVDLLHGSILKSLLLFALPIMASRVFQQIYNTMDTLIVAIHSATRRLRRWVPARRFMR